MRRVVLCFCVHLLCCSKCNEFIFYVNLVDLKCAQLRVSFHSTSEPLTYIYAANADVFLHVFLLLAINLLWSCVEKLRMKVKHVPTFVPTLVLCIMFESKGDKPYLTEPEECYYRLLLFALEPNEAVSKILFKHFILHRTVV